jgi:hypothetical protein
VHEFAHAWVADRFGDSTPRINGRLTLNPLAHLDPLGSIMMILVGFGWAKPVPVNPYALKRRSPAATMWVSLAGPMSNFLMALVAAVFYRITVIFAGGNVTAFTKEAIVDVIKSGFGGNKRALASASSCSSMKPTDLLDIVFSWHNLPDNIIFFGFLDG